MFDEIRDIRAEQKLASVNPFRASRSPQQGKRMSGWKRLFVVIATCWVLVAPFLTLNAINDPVNRIFGMCLSDVIRNNPQYDARYEAELNKCSSAFRRDYVTLPKILSAMVGMGDRTHGLLAWGVILIPLCLLWVLGKIVGWVAAGFRH
jgi:hypothetical protein